MLALVLPWFEPGSNQKNGLRAGIYSPLSVLVFILIKTGGDLAVVRAGFEPGLNHGFVENN
jgi:hypothetical protein